MTKSSTEKSPNPQNFQLRWRNCPFPAIFPPRTTSFPTRPALHTNTIQMWNKYISDAAQIHKYNTAHEPTLLLSLWLPVLPQLPRVRELFTQKLPTEWPTVSHRQDNPLLRPTCDPYLWRPLYLKLWCQIQIHLQYSQKILENHSAIQLSSSSNHFWTASDISCKQVLKIHVHHIPKLIGPSLCNGVNIVTYITK